MKLCIVIQFLLIHYGKMSRYRALIFLPFHSENFFSSIINHYHYKLYVHVFISHPHALLNFIFKIHARRRNRDIGNMWCYLCDAKAIRGFTKLLLSSSLITFKAQYVINIYRIWFLSLNSRIIYTWNYNAKSRLKNKKCHDRDKPNIVFFF